MDFRDYQTAFAARIRDPQAQPRPRGVPARRMRVYEQLLFNSIEAALRGGFPRCRELLGVRAWRRLVRAFFRDHACQTPFYRAIPGELLDYLASGPAPALPNGLPDWLPELAHYEWVELDLEVSNADAALPAFDAAGDLLGGVPLLNPVHHLLAYRYPVQRLSRRFRPATAPALPTFILAYRDPALNIVFQTLNARTAALLDVLTTHPDASGDEALEILSTRLPDIPASTLRADGAAMLARFHRDGVILGTRR